MLLTMLLNLRTPLIVGLGSNMGTIEISDNELFELLGRKDCEIYMNEKIIKDYEAKLEKVKELILQMELLKKEKTELENSNKSLSETNIKLDQALTEARKERDIYKAELESVKLEFEKFKEVKDVNNKGKKRK